MQNYLNINQLKSFMLLELDKKPKGVTIVAGFPGFGLIGTIATEFLIEHLNAVQIGKIRIEELPPVVAIHQGKVIEPLGIFYDKKYNLVILHALTLINNIEWQLETQISKLMVELKPKKVITIEGIGNAESQTPNIYYLSKGKDDSKKLNLPQLKEGIIIGVSGALLLKNYDNLLTLFAETKSALPDSFIMTSRQDSTSRSSLFPAMLSPAYSVLSPWNCLKLRMPGIDNSPKWI